MVKAPRKAAAKALRSTLPEQKRTRLSQQDVPSCSIEKALRVARAIGENYGFKPSSPIQVARALNVQPPSGPFKMLTGASIAYGLTTRADTTLKRSLWNRSPCGSSGQPRREMISRRREKPC